MAESRVPWEDMEASFLCIWAIVEYMKVVFLVEKKRCISDLSDGGNMYAKERRYSAGKGPCPS